MIRQWLVSRAYAALAKRNAARYNRYDEPRPLMPVAYVENMPLWKLPGYWITANVKWAIWISLIGVTNAVFFVLKPMERTTPLSNTAYPRRMFFSKVGFKQFWRHLQEYKPWEHRQDELVRRRVEKIFKKYRFPKNHKGGWY